MPARGDSLTRYSSSLASGIIETFPSVLHDGHAGASLPNNTVALQKHDSQSAKCLSEPIIAVVDVVVVTACCIVAASCLAQCAHIPCRWSVHRSKSAYSLPVFYIG